MLVEFSFVFSLVHQNHTISEDFRLLVTFLLLTFTWLFCGFFAALICLEKQCFCGLFRGLSFGQGCCLETNMGSYGFPRVPAVFCLSWEDLRVPAKLCASKVLCFLGKRENRKHQRKSAKMAQFVLLGLSPYARPDFNMARSCLWRRAFSYFLGSEVACVTTDSKPHCSS